MLSHVEDVYVRFGADSGTPFSYEPRKWFNCLQRYGVYPDEWIRNDLHRRITHCWLSEYRNSLNLTLRINGSLDADLRTIFASLPGAKEVQIFHPTSQTPESIPIPRKFRPQAEIVPIGHRTAA